MLATLLTAAVIAVPAHATPANCGPTFTRPMIERAINATYRGTKDVSAKERRHLRRFIHCARRHVNRNRMRRILHHAWVAWNHRRHPPPPPLQTAIASWYTTEGTGACGYGTVQTGYRFASLFLACGTRVLFCRGATCIVGEMADHGPYVSGRSFDLNYNMKTALGCGGICVVRWRIA